jgi:DNA-directed RNA polymerase specialized sigma24 family protein
VEYNDAYIKSALDAAATRTYRMAARFGLSPADREDLQQELILDLLEHQEKFDPAKGSAGTFTGMVSKHRSVECLDRLMRDRSRLAFIGHLDANDDDDVDGDTFSGKPDPDGHNVVLMWADDADLFSDSDTVRDLETALSYLSEEQASMYALLETHQNLPAACKASGVSAATFYRRVSELQMHLRMFGFKSAA